MSEPFIAEVRIFAGNFAPRGWAFCNGQLLPIAQNTALFSLVGTTYGGDGRTTMGLPDLQGRAAMHPGRGPGLSSRRLGESGGAETVTLTEAQTPQHRHGDSPSNAFGATATTGTPSNDAALAATASDTPIYGPASDLEATGTTTGGGQPHNNLQPYLVLNFIIALIGLFPSRS